MLRSSTTAHMRRWNTSLVYFGVLLLLWSFYRISIREARFDHHEPSVNVVLATVVKGDISWTKELVLTNFEAIPYVADNQSAPYHPPTNRGNEAMVYLTYCYEFYHTLPDITIFTHGQDHEWHIDGVLDYSTVRAINSLDLHEVLHRKYLNLRLSWQNACPVWINTSIDSHSPQFDIKLREEEPFVREAFEWFLPNHPVPEIFASPCCSQFAVTREAIRSLPQEAYLAAMNWIEDTVLPSSITGRVFEHIWQYMFLRKPVDCPNEFKALCRAYHICFEDEEDWIKWREMEASRNEFNKFRTALLSNGVSLTNQRVKDLEKEIAMVEKVLVPWRMKAIQRGRNAKKRMKLAGGEF